MSALRLAVAAALPVALAASAAAQDWTTLPLGTTDDVYAIEQGSFSDKWLVGANGLVRHSDATRTVWTADSALTSVYLRSVHRSSSAELWIGGHAGTVRFRSFGSWSVRDTPDSTQDFVLAGDGSGAARALGSGGAIYHSVNGGVSWTQETSGVSVALRAGVNNLGTAWAVGDAGTILRTTDGGTTWNPEVSGTTEDLRCLLQGSNGRLYALGANGTILRSPDQGVTWNAISAGTSADLYAVSSSKLNADHMVAVGEAGTVIRSTDAGSTWCHLNAGTAVNLYAVEAVSNTEYLVGGAGGLLLRTTTGGGACGSPLPAPLSPMPAALRLAGPFPNPLRESGRLELIVDREQAVRVDVYDVTGRHVVRLLEDVLAPGTTRRVALAPEGSWPAGVYYVRARGAGFTVSRRLVLVR